MEIKTFPKQPSQCHCTNMRRASRAVTQFYDSLMEPAGLKVTQYSLLNHLKRLGPLTMKELSQAVRLERTTLIRNLKPLENAGLVSVETQKAATARMVRLTDKGLNALESAFPYWKQAQQYLNELLSEEESQVWDKVMQKMESVVP